MYKPRDGRDGRDGVDGKDGRDGKDADANKIVQEVLRRVPKGKDGADGRDGKDVQTVRQKWEANFVKDQYERTAYVDVMPAAGGAGWRITPKHEGDLMYFAEITPL